LIHENDHGAADALAEMCREGKQITLQITITDTVEAQKLLGKSIQGESFNGIQIDSWGFFDRIKAMELKEQAIKAMVDTLQNALNMDSSNFKDADNDPEN